MLIHLHGNTDASVTNWELGFFGTRQNIVYFSLQFDLAMGARVRLSIKCREDGVVLYEAKMNNLPFHQCDNALEQV